MAMRIIDLHDQETADRFFAELTDFDNDYGTDSAIVGVSAS